MVEEADQNLLTAHISATHISDHDGDVTWKLFSWTMMIIRVHSAQHQTAGRLEGLKKRQEGLDSNLAVIQEGFWRKEDSIKTGEWVRKKGSLIRIV